MKELDLILERYARAALHRGSAAELAALERFLGLPDPVIAGCLLGEGHLEDPGLEGIVQRIRYLCQASPVC